MRELCCPTTARLQRPSTELAPSYLEVFVEIRALGETIGAGWEPRQGESHGQLVERLLPGEHDPEQGVWVELL